VNTKPDLPETAAPFTPENEQGTAPFPLPDRPLPDTACGVRHLAIIMDGNGRWATLKNLSRSEGHRAGTEAAKLMVETCARRGIQHLTLYTFSTENWKRPADEVHFLFDLLADFITRELPQLIQQGVRLNVFGEMGELPFASRQVLAHAMRKTAPCRAMHLNLALNYSGRLEIARAARLFMEAGRPAAEMTPETLAEYLYTANQPDPDLIIRTSGEFRTSNFLLFQSAYSELYFTDTLWPDFSPEELDRALAVFQKRVRRFGGLSTI